MILKLHAQAAGYPARSLEHGCRSSCTNGLQLLSLYPPPLLPGLYHAKPLTYLNPTKRLWQGQRAGNSLLGKLAVLRFFSLRYGRLPHSRQQVLKRPAMLSSNFFVFRWRTGVGGDPCVFRRDQCSVNPMKWVFCSDSVSFLGTFLRG